MPDAQQPTSEEVGSWVDRIGALVAQFVQMGMTQQAAEAAAETQIVQQAAADPSPSAPAAAASAWEQFLGGGVSSLLTPTNVLLALGAAIAWRRFG